MLYYIIRGILIPFIYLLYWPKVVGKENIPASGPVIIYSNHTSLLDPVILGCLLPRQIHFMAKIELFKNRPVAWFLKKLGAFPVKRGSADITAIKKSLQLLKEGRLFGIFPEGTRSKSGSLQEFNNGTASIAHKSKAVTLPAIIIGGYSVFKPIKVIIGKPLDFHEYYEQRTNSELIGEMSEKMSRALLDIIYN